MNFNLDSKGFEKYLIERHDDFIGRHYVFKFKNNYGASVIKGIDTYGGPQDLWELAVIRFSDDGHSYYLDYNTKITDEVVGYQTDKMIRKLLRRIKWLRKHK